MKNCIVCMLACLMFSGTCSAWERYRDGSVSFNPKFVKELNKDVTMGIAYSDKKFAKSEAKRFVQKWAVGFDRKISKDTKVGLRIGYDDAGKSQKNAVGFVIGTTF